MWWRGLGRTSVRTVLLLLVATASSGLTPEEARTSYDSLEAYRFGASVGVPEGGLTLTRGPATFGFASGSLRYAEPVADGSITGLLFDGSGRFRMAVEDPIERAHLRRIAERDDLDGIDTAFTKVVLRTSDPLPESWPAPPAGSFENDGKARRHHQDWIERHGHNAISRVLGGLLTPGSRYLRVDIETEDFGWLTFEHDSLRPESIALARWDPTYGGLEEWLRFAWGEAGEAQLGDPVDFEHLDVRVDLKRSAKRTGPLGRGKGVQPRMASFRAELRWRARLGGPRALMLSLSSIAKVTAVETADGRPLGFLRHQLDKEVSVFDEDKHEGGLVVLLDEPLAAGEVRTIVVTYDREVLNYLPGNVWYPTPATRYFDAHTARIEVASRKKDDVRAMGVLREERATDDGKLWVFEIEKAALMVTFSFAERFHEESMAVDGVPEVVGFSMTTGSKNKVYNVVADVVNSLNYFQQLFDTKVDAERLYATAILGGHGQAFDGFLHLSDLTFTTESSGPTELFRAHEVAHQWWGHMVQFESYRDQWISEAFAEYSAIMFIEASMEKGSDFYEEIIAAYAGNAIGTIDRPSRFLRFVLEANDRQRKRIGPISLGYRASTSTSPLGYTSQAYFKGPVVLHMLRTMLRNVTQNDDLFVQVLRDFVKTYRGKPATTADFQDVLARHARDDWQWFFDQWVHGTAIPTYAWRWDVVDGEGGKQLEITVEQSGVPEGFRMPVPVQVDFGKKQGGQVMVMVDQPSVSLRVPIPRAPKKVTFNPGNAVLANVEKLK